MANEVVDTGLPAACIGQYEAIKSKLPAYKGMKWELGELEAEVRHSECVL
jgi:hypothetical protein